MNNTFYVPANIYLLNDGMKAFVAVDMYLTIK